MATRLAEAPEPKGTPLDKAPELALRGDPITGDRYTSVAFYEREWKQMWSRTWHIGGLVYQVPEPGD